MSANLADKIALTLAQEIERGGSPIPCKSWAMLTEVERVQLHGLAQAVIRALLSPPDNVISALIETTPSP